VPDRDPRTTRSHAYRELQLTSLACVLAAALSGCAGWDGAQKCDSAEVQDAVLAAFRQAAAQQGDLRGKAGWMATYLDAHIPTLSGISEKVRHESGSLECAAVLSVPRSVDGDKKDRAEISYEVARKQNEVPHPIVVIKELDAMADEFVEVALANEAGGRPASAK
jgi:hypothetical protein